MENPRRSNRGFEENTMAIIDASLVKEARDAEDDRLSFLEAVRAGSIVSDTASVPTRKMFEAIFQILKDDTSLELIMASYQILNELEERFPRIFLSHPDTSSTTVELVVVKEAWSPFVVGSENAYCDRDATSGNSHDLLDSSRFVLLTQDICQAVSEGDLRSLGTKSLRDMLVFQYLVDVLEGDFVSRYTVYKDTMDWALFKESLLNMLLGSRRINFKSLIKDCLSIVYERSHHARFCQQDQKMGENSLAETLNDDDAALALAAAELEKRTYIAVQKFLTLIMELDVIKKEADVQGVTSRADGLRTPLVDVILDEITYNKDLLPLFLEHFSEPKWKLEIILQYFSKYCKKPSVRTRRSNNDSDDATFDSVLKCFSNGTSVKGVIKKISPEVAQLLLAHAFQAYLSMLHIADSDKNNGSSSLVHISKNMVAAFQNLRRIKEHMEITPFEKEALFMAATFL